MEQFIPFQPSSPIFILIVVIAVFLESYAYRKKFNRAYPWVDSLTSLGMGVGFLIKVEKSSRSMSLRILIFGEMRACPLGG